MVNLGGAQGGQEGNLKLFWPSSPMSPGDTSSPRGTSSPWPTSSIGKDVPRGKGGPERMI